MGRVFTVNFKFKQQPVTALVNVRDRGYDLSCIVRYLDQEVATLLPGGKLIFSLAHGLESPVHLAGKPQEELFHRTTEAISHYLGAS
jgi:hypothetical protein